MLSPIQRLSTDIFQDSANDLYGPPRAGLCKNLRITGEGDAVRRFAAALGCARVEAREKV